MSAPEARFSQAWATLVDFIASAYFLCDLQTTDVLQNLLPTRVLQVEDQAPFIKDLPRLQNRAIALIDALDKANEVTDGKLEKLWCVLYNFRLFDYFHSNICYDFEKPGA